MNEPLVWVDLEMTGLDPERERIVEIAVVVTDGALERLQEGPQLVVGVPSSILQRMQPAVAMMHAESGLADEVRGCRRTAQEAEQEVLDFVRQHVPEPRSAPLAGNSIHSDRAFLRRYMPRLEAHLHYRNVDVSTVKELIRRWYPDVFARAPAKTGGHRALADIHESIQELRYYRREVFR